MRAVRSFDPLLWRIEVEAGVRTADLRRRARENGLFFPPDPGAAEQSCVGGNIATNAGGPHAFKYGVTGHWVTGVEAAIAPGELVRVGGPVRKDVAGFDLRGLLVGSEGTLGIVTAAWLRLLPAPAVVLPVVAFYAGAEAGCAAIEAVVGAGVVAAALEYVDGGALRIAAPAYPGGAADGAGFAVIAEADGAPDEAARVRDELREALADGALAVEEPDPAALWRWRDGVSIAVAAARGGKVSDDVVVPLERLGEALRGTLEIGARHGLEAVSWGHAGDGNLHSSFLVGGADADELARAERAALELAELARALGGSASGEHGLGILKRGHVAPAPRVAALQRAIKGVFDPKGLLNPGKKL
jgi:FAD/FMN-containing dehydrogenase